MALKPCPTCGGSGEVLVEIKGDPRDNGQDQVATVQRWVRCGTCDGSRYVASPDDEDDDQDKGKGGGRDGRR